MATGTGPAAERGSAGIERIGTLPHNVEAEQQLLGAILTNNDLYERVADLVRAEHFYDPLHGRIFALAASRIQKNALASPVTLKAFLAEDEGLKQVGGPSYLVRLAGGALSTYAVRDYARLIRDLALRRDLIALGRDIADRAARVEAEGEAREQIVEAEQRLYQMAELGPGERGFRSLLAAAATAVEAAEAAYRRDGGLAGLSTGLADLDRKLGGLHRSDLVILAGRPSMGKTALATNIAFAIARAYQRGTRPDGTEGAVNGGIVGFFSLEMSAEQLATRILSEVSEIPSDRIRRGDLSWEEFRRFAQAARELEACPLYIDDTPAIPIAQLAARARRLKRTQGLDVLFVDYLQLIRPATARDSRVNEVSEITQALKAIAKELDIPVVALSQLSRQVENREDKRPQLSDLRESGSIEQDADVVMFVFREEYYREREKPAEHDLDATRRWQETMEAVRGRAEVIIGKQRHGPIGTVELAFDGALTRFSDMARPWQRDAAEGYR